MSGCGLAKAGTSNRVYQNEVSRKYFKLRKRKKEEGTENTG
jgi:hypothetical protein